MGSAARSFSTASVFAFLAFWAIPSEASDDAAAEALFLQGREAMSRGDYAKACPMLEESYRLVPGVGTRFNLGDCYENLGKTASAWAAFRGVAAASKLARQTDREAAASARVTALEGKLCRAAIRVATQDDVTITRDGEVVGVGQWSVFLPVDPGVHTVEGKASGKTPWSTTFTVKDCPTNVNVAVPVLASLVSVTTTTTPTADVAPRAAEPNHVQSSRTRTVAMLGSLGLGVVAVGFGSYFGVHAWSLRDQSNDGHCNGNRCDDEGRALRDRSLFAGNGATVALIAGGVLLAVGAWLWLTDTPKTPNNTTRSSRIP